MSYINHVLQRTTIQSLREYLLYGVDKTESYSSESYEIRLKNAFEQLLDIVNKYDSTGEGSVLFTTFNHILTEYENVYMEMGIQSGFRLATDITMNNAKTDENTDYKKMYFLLFNAITKSIETLQLVQMNAEEMYLRSEVKGQGEAETP